MLIFLLGIPIIVWPHLYVNTGELLGETHWFRIDFAGGWEEAVSELFFIVAQGNYLEDGIFPVSITILVFIGIYLLCLSNATIVLLESKKINFNKNIRLIRRIVSFVVINGVAIGVTGLVLFAEFVKTIRNIKPIDF
ncbi:MAG: hypothetical protein ACTSSK_02695 [Candidatus Heimdallarchaeota archaeon]